MRSERSPGDHWDAGRARAVETCRVRWFLRGAVWTWRGAILPRPVSSAGRCVVIVLRPAWVGRLRWRSGIVLPSWSRGVLALSFLGPGESTDSFPPSLSPPPSAPSLYFSFLPSFSPFPSLFLPLSCSLFFISFLALLFFIFSSLPLSFAHSFSFFFLFISFLFFFPGSNMKATISVG